VQVIDFARVTRRFLDEAIVAFEAG